jgi:hypothetical protein
VQRFDSEQASQLEPQNPLHKTRLKELYERDAPQYLDKAVGLHNASTRGSVHVIVDISGSFV